MYIELCQQNICLFFICSPVMSGTYGAICGLLLANVAIQLQNNCLVVNYASLIMLPVANSMQTVKTLSCTANAAILNVLHLYTVLSIHRIICVLWNSRVS